MIVLLGQVANVLFAKFFSDLYGTIESNHPVYTEFINRFDVADVGIFNRQRETSEISATEES